MRCGGRACLSGDGSPLEKRRIASRDAEIAHLRQLLYEGTPEYDDITAEKHEETFSEASYGAGEPDYLDDRPNDCDDPEGYDDWYERNRV